MIAYSKNGELIIPKTTRRKRKITLGSVKITVFFTNNYIQKRCLISDINIMLRKRNQTKMSYDCLNKQGPA